jgi:hypothetical protein
LLKGFENERSVDTVGVSVAALLSLPSRSVAASAGFESDVAWFCARLLISTLVGRHPIQYGSCKKNQREDETFRIAKYQEANTNSGRFLKRKPTELYSQQFLDEA